MDTLEDTSCGCPGAAEILADLDADMLDMQPGERLWKLYCVRVAGHATSLRHRIYSKRKADGRLALVTFAVHNPRGVGADGNGNSAADKPPGPAARSGIARAPDLSVEDLGRIITAVRRQAQANADVCEEVDLTVFASLQEQIAWLEGSADVPEPR